MGLETRPSSEGRPAPTPDETAPVESRAESPPPEPQAPASAASASDLPPIAAKADDLEAIKKAVDDAASVGGGLWLSYLFVLFYLAVAAGAVTHADLFFEKPVKLPFLDIELPLVAFFVLAPILFVIVHAYTLVHLVMLTDKAKRYHQALYEQIEDKDGARRPKRRKATRDKLRRQLPSNIFIQFLAGPSDLRESAFGWLLRGIAWITLVVAPVLLLLIMQIQFLPYHSGLVTWTQRDRAAPRSRACLVAVAQEFCQGARSMRQRLEDSLAAASDRRCVWLSFPCVLRCDRDLSGRVAGRTCWRSSGRIGVETRSRCLTTGSSTPSANLVTRAAGSRSRARSSCRASTYTRASASTIPRRRSGGTSSSVPAGAI